MSAQFPLPLPFLRTKEAARFIGLSVSTLQKLRIYGTGPKYSKIGGRIIYAVGDLREWIELAARRSTADKGRTAILPTEPADKVASDGTAAVDVEAAGAARPDTREAARFLGLSYRTLEKHRIYGTGPKYSKVGRRVVYAINDLREWASGGARSSTSDPGRTTVLPAIPSSKRAARSGGDVR